MSKLMSLTQAVGLINNGDSVGIGGNVLHRAPMAIIREIARQQKRNLKIIKTAGAMDVDLLCLAECVYSVDAGFISYETEYSLAGHYRKAVQNGVVKGNEHACYTVISALRAASAGIPFMPVKGLQISDLIAVNDYFTKIQDPFSGEMVTVVKALKPTVAIIHVQEADINGNARIIGPKFDDVLLSRAADKVIISAETIVAETKFAYSSEKADIPHFMVDAVIKAPKGAAPCSCPTKYDIDRKDLDLFKSIKDKEGLDSYLERYQTTDYRG